MPRGPRVLVDATAIPAERGGVGRYVDEVVEQMAALGADLVIACQPRDLDRYRAGAPDARLAPAPRAAERRPVRMAWEQTGLPLVALRTRADVIFSPHYTTPATTTVPRVVTFHDATFFSDPELHLPTKARFFRGATRTSLRVARRGITPSTATREELVRLASADATHLDVVPHGVDLGTFSPPDDERLRVFCETYDLEPGRYIAFLGTLEPRKNLSALVQGWAIASRQVLDPVPLVLAGGAGWDQNLYRVLRDVPRRLRVVRPGYLPIEDLPPLLGGAAVVAYPSLGEGFGLPVLEAMACGATVLTTRRLSLPEVGGDAVAYTEPDATSIAEGLARLLDDATARKGLADAALSRARTFTWRRSAEGHLRAFGEAAR